jgi:hypothetical protein
LHQHRVLAERGAQGQLIEGDDFAACLDDAVTSAVRNAKSTDLKMKSEFIQNIEFQISTSGQLAEQ